MVMHAFRKLKIAALVTLMAGAASLLAASDAFAQRDRDARGRDFHGRDFRRFSVEERGLWLGGRWFHDFHNGRYGWWWVVDGVWYFYPQPIYPYPTYIPEPEAVVSAPPPGAYPTPPAYGVPAPPPAWYYCDNPQGYYPYVQACSSGWRQVPAAPPGNQPPPAPR